MLEGGIIVDSLQSAVPAQVPLRESENRFTNSSFQPMHTQQVPAQTDGFWREISRDTAVLEASVPKLSPSSIEGIYKYLYVIEAFSLFIFSVILEFRSIERIMSRLFRDLCV